MYYTVAYESLGKVAEPPPLSNLLRPSEKCCWASNLPPNTLVLPDKKNPRYFQTDWNDIYSLTEILPRDPHHSLYILRKWIQNDMDSICGGTLNQCITCG